MLPLPKKSKLNISINSKTMKTSHKKVIEKTKLSVQKMVSDVKAPAAIVLGMVGGKIVGDMLDNILKKTSTVAGLGAVASAVSYVKPIALVVIGLSAKQLVKNPFVQNVGIGMAAYGGAMGIQSVINIPQLNQVTGGGAALPPVTTSPGTAGFGYLPRPVLPMGSRARTTKQAVIL